MHLKAYENVWWDEGNPGELSFTQCPMHRWKVTASIYQKKNGGSYGGRYGGR